FSILTNMRDFDLQQSFSRRRTVTVALGLALLLPASLLISAAAVPQSSKARKAKPAAANTTAGFETAAGSFVKKYCIACHSGSSAQAAILLGRENDSAGVLKNRKTW